MGTNNEKKRKTPNKKAWIIALSCVLGLAAIINIASGFFRAHLDLYLGRGKAVITRQKGTESWNSQYYKSDYASADELKAAANKAVEGIEAEGIVLLKNDGALPLKTASSAKARVTLLGRDAADPVYGGSGSGSTDLSTVTDLKTALEGESYEVNPTAYATLLKYASFKVGKNQFGAPARVYTHPKANIVMDKPQESNYAIGEMPVSGYGSADKASFVAYGEAAIVMFGRGGGEGGDLARDIKGSDANYKSGQHELQLNKDELDLIALAKANFKKVIVLINSSNPMELGSLKNDPGVSAVLWVGSPGQTGFKAVGKVLSGAITPSGRTADIYPADFSKDPTFQNFGNYQYANISSKNAIGNAYFVRYAEGIYVGYRYYETAAKEGFIDYDKAVVYPFGYGLSYADFKWEVTGKRLGDSQGNISVDVKVTNVSPSYSGKDVVQLYYSAPYAKGGIEKSEVVLGDFAKTKILKPGESQLLTLSFPVESMASYDYKGEKAYVLDAGTYSIRVQSDSHSLKAGIKPIEYKVNAKVAYSGANHRGSDKVAVTNRFDDASAQFTDAPKDGLTTVLSRANFAGTFPVAPKGADFQASDAVIASFQAFKAKDHEDKSAKMPKTGAANGISLINLRGQSYDDPLWGTLLDQVTAKDVASLVTDSAYKTAAIQSVEKPATVDLDGPAGLSSFMGNTHGTAYPSEVVVASSFNPDNARAMGVMVGNESLNYKVNGWYAPAMNIHRSPFAGRDFEYYSEDPLLSGKLASSVVSGAAEKGVYTFIKHFALNDQETNRVNDGVCSWANEQAIREIYLRPFEIVVKTAKAKVPYISDNKGTLSTKEMSASTAVMSSFNRIGATWAGGNPALLKRVLRDEWGFRGMVISDFNLYPYMFADQGTMAGTDLNITFASMKSLEDATSATAVTRLRESAHNILYTVANSNAMNGLAPGASVTYETSSWQRALIAFDVIVALFLIVGVAQLALRTRRAKESGAS